MDLSSVFIGIAIYVQQRWDITIQLQYYNAIT